MDFLERMVYRQSKASQDQEVHQEPLGPKEKMGIKVYQGPLVLQGYPVQRDKVGLLVKLGPKVRKEFQGWMVQQDLLDHQDPQGRTVPQGHQDNRVCPVPPDLRAHLEQVT
ncbi:hypothetical protein CRUP_004074 [Coryphaenoides rupestris]|nr:hypothetical protein CRUP_004074 [Coryphaenoides rupestris]